MGDIDGAIEDGITHTFSESLKIFYKKAGIFSEVSDFYNHTTYLFVRFQPSELADLKVLQQRAQILRHMRKERETREHGDHEERVSERARE
jgi:hypothetical protein